MSDQDKPMYDVFLSHNSADKPAVEALGQRLREAGFNPFLDKWHLVPGKPWQTELADALKQSACTAIFFGRSGEGAWHVQEMQVALNNAVRTRDDYRVIPVLLPGSDPAQVGGFLELRTWVDFRSGLDDEVALQRLTAAIKGVAPDSAEGLLELPDDPRPYRGIERFEGEQHQFFFGRDDEIRRLIERLEQDRFVAVVGASGSGKSSLARAGFYTDAAEQAKPGIRHWRRIMLMPKNNPLLQLAANLVAHLPECERPALFKTFIDDFRNSPDGLIIALTTLFPNPDQPVLLLVDQFEELFTQRPPADQGQTEWRERTASFAANLLAAVHHKLDWLRIVVTLRADFVDRFVGGDFADYLTLLERRQFWLGAMGEEDLREVIVRPATQRGAFFEKGLVERLLAEMRGEASALPLLEEALSALWDRRRGPWLTHQAYDEIGGVGGALADKADRIFNSLKPSDQAIARRVFLKLIQLGEGSRDTRRRVSIASLQSVTDLPSDFQTVVDQFSTVGSRLITFSSDEETSEGEAKSSHKTAEVTHEALIDHWDRLSRWLDEGRDDQRLERRLEEAASHWKVEAEKPDGKPGGLLWRPPELDLARDYVKRIEGSLPQLQFDFYQLSDRAEKERIAKEKAQRQRELEQERKLAEEQAERAKEQKAAATRFKWIATIAGCIAVIAVVAGFYAFQQKGVADAKLIESQAASIMAGLRGDGESPTVDEYESLKLLADSSSAVRFTFMEHLLGSPAKSKRLRSRFPYIVQAVVGLDAQARDQLRGVLLQHGRNPSTKAMATNVACAKLGWCLDVDDGEFNQMVACNYLAAAQKQTEGDALVDLGRALGRMGNKLPAGHAATAAEQIVAAIVDETADPYRWDDLAVALIELGEKLPAEQAAVAVKHFVAAIAIGIEGFPLDELDSVLIRLAEMLPAKQAAEVAQQIVAAMEKTPDWGGDDRLDDVVVGVLGKLGEKLSKEQAADIAQRILPVLENSAGPRSLYFRGRALGSLGEKPPAQQAAAGAKKIVAALVETKRDDDRRYDLAVALGSLSENLSTDEAAARAKEIVAAMEMATDDELKSLAGALGSLGPKLPAEQAAAGAEKIVAAMRTAADPAWYNLGSALGRLGDQLPAEQAVAGAQQIVAALENTMEDRQSLYSLCRALGEFGEKLPTKQAATIGEQILTGLENSPEDRGALLGLGSTLASLAANLPAEQAAIAAPHIVDLMGSTTDLYSLDALGRVLSSLVERAPPEQAAALAQQIVADMEKASKSDYYGALSLGSVLGSFGEKLSANQAAAGAKQIVETMESATDWAVLDGLGRGLDNLGAKLPAEQAAAFAQEIIAGMKTKNINTYTLTLFGITLGNLGDKIPPEYIAAAAHQIVLAIEQTDFPNAFSRHDLALWRLGEKLPAETAAVLAQRVVAAMAKTTDSNNQTSLGAALGSFAVTMKKEDTIAVLKSLVCVGATRDKVLAGLERKTGQQFGGNVWIAVAWLEEQEIDVNKIDRWRLEP